MLKLENLKERGNIMTLCSVKQKQIVHVLKNKYGITDVEYRDLLVYNFDGVDSTLGLTEEECDKFIHILNYKYSQDYKYGYDRGVKVALKGRTSLAKFELGIQNKYDRECTDIEIQMFNNMDYEQQENIIQSLFE